MSISPLQYAPRRKKFRRLSDRLQLAAGATLLAFAPVAARSAPGPADLVLRNGRIETMDAARSRAGALAVRAGRVLWVGFDDGVDPWVGPATRVVDLGGRYVLPGFQDSHVHPVSSGVELLGCDLNDSRSADEVRARIARCAAARPDDEWIVGGGWDLPLFPGGNPHRRVLDELADGRAVYLSSADGHSAWVSSRVLELAGISASTPNPPAGRIERDADGTPSGTLRETAMVPAQRTLPPPSPERFAAGLREAVRIAHGFGITGVVEADGSESLLTAYAALDRAGELDLHVTAAVRVQPEGGLAQISELERLRASDWGPHVRATAVKIFADGVLEAQTGALLAPYVGRGGDRGELVWSEERLREIAVELDRRGFQLHVHAIGDRAIRATFDAIEAAAAANGRRDRRPTLAHIQLFAPEDVPRFRRLGAAASFQPLWAYEDSYIRDLTVPFLGPERSRWLYPIGSVARTGAVLAGGSDWSVSSMNPLAGIEVAITRRDPRAEPGPPWIPEETVDLRTMLAAYTIGSAWASFRERDTGSLEPGKLADLVVLDRDLFAVPPTEISDAEVLLTLFAGEVVYRDPDLPAGVLELGGVTAPDLAEDSNDG